MQMYPIHIPQLFPHSEQLTFSRARCERVEIFKFIEDYIKSLMYSLSE